MTNTPAIPNTDPMAQTPLPALARPASSWISDSDSDAPAEAEGPSTHVVMVRPTPARIPNPNATKPHPLAVTPAPLTDIQFPASAWSNDNTSEGSNSARTPRVGETLHGFKLVSELGRGAFARVFLAEQESLANRQVAVKVTLRPTREAERLARLQHTNVVPVYSVHNEGTVQVICMPYLGRMTIADLIRAYRTDHSRHSGSGRKSTSVRAARSTQLDSKHKSHSKFASDSRGGRRGDSHAPVWTWSSDQPPPIVGDPVAVLQTVGQLAAGLAHAHARGILHLDLKPANVLLADTGEPMLLDFNLAYDASAPARELIGGTMPYMAIEQLIDTRQRGKGTIDERTDIYALGVMTFEMLTGTVLFPTMTKGLRIFDAMIEARRKGPPSIRALNPAVTPAVEALVRKMLAPDAADRYQSADNLREDIERHLNDQPLKYARETSLRERAKKWRRRNPGLPARLTVALLLASAMCLGVFAYDRLETHAKTEARQKAVDTHDSLGTIRLDLVLPGDANGRARGVKQATEQLAAYGLPGDADWQKRRDVQRLSESKRTALAGDLGEMAALLAQAKWQEAESRPKSDRAELIAEAWKLNTAARACFTPETMPPFLNRQAAIIAPAAGETFTVPEGAPKPEVNARNGFLDGVSHMTARQYKSAIPIFDRVISAEPNHAAAHFCLAYCRQQMGQYEAAIERFDVVRALLPKDPRPAWYRGMSYALLKQPDLAEEEFSKTLAIDPNHADALRHRGLVRYRIATNASVKKDGEKIAAQKLGEAEADLNAAQERGAPLPFIYFVRAHVRDQRGNLAGANADRAAAKSITLKTEEDFITSGWSRMESNPRGAADDFEKALALNPRSLLALQNLLPLLVNRSDDNDKALAVATRLTEQYSEFVPAFAWRAVLLARLGRREEAHREIEQARLKSSDSGEIAYLAASVYALTAKTDVEDATKAVEMLRVSLRKGYAGVRDVETDSSFEAIRDNAGFKKVSEAVSTIYK